jgi:SMI1 / KNR4 family (SUKH-1)
VREEACAALFHRMHEKCQRQQWYGPEMRDLAWFGNRYDPALDHDGRLRARLNDPQKNGFKYPSATEEQLLATEEALGFALPPLLRALYAQVANGGFGFGYGVCGAMEGFDEDSYGTIVDHYLARADTEHTYPWCSEQRRLVNLADSDGQWEEIPAECEDGVVRTFRYLILTSCVWPERFLPICNWGCGIESCVDCTRGGVYRVGITEDESYLISLQAPSLDDMLKRWVQLPYDSPLFVRGY